MAVKMKMIVLGEALSTTTLQLLRFTKSLGVFVNLMSACNASYQDLFFE